MHYGKFCKPKRDYIHQMLSVVPGAWEMLKTKMYPLMLIMALMMVVTVLVRVVLRMMVIAFNSITF